MTIIEDVSTTIMMVTYNRLDLTKQTLNDLLISAQYPFRLILIDNGSSDQTIEWLESFCKENVGQGDFLSYQIIDNKANKGIAVGRNQGLEAAKTTWLCTLDNDVLLPKNWLRECIDILQHNRSFGMIGVNFEGTKYPLIKRGDLEFEHKPRGNLGTACTVFNKSLHRLLGYFNTEYGIYGLEDSDWGMRVRVAGLKLGYLKEHGTHLGQGAADQGAYREFKTAEHDRYLKKFNENCANYTHKTKSIYISLKKK
jgi:GT2 family glycosyltransferase